MNYKRIEIAPSILSADFSILSNVADEVEASGARYLHLDVMDGQFVPQITFGPKLVSDLRNRSGLIFDAHLMIMNPENQIEAFAQAGCDYITIHQESCIHLNRVLNRSKETGATAGNLSVQIDKLSAARYVEVTKTFRGKKPCTLCRITPLGVQAFEEYVEALKTYIVK